MTNLGLDREIAGNAGLRSFLDPATHLLDLLPVGVYVCDRAGLITYYNPMAAELWGAEPKIGDDSARFCGSYRMRDFEDGVIPHAECPMAIALDTGRAFRDERLVVEREDGSRVVVKISIEPIKAAGGDIVGAVNVFRPANGGRFDETDMGDVRGIAAKLLRSKRAAGPATRRVDNRHRKIFDNVRVALWEEDFSGVVALLEEIRAEGVLDLRSHLAAHPELVTEAISRVRILDVNDYTVELYEAASKEDLLHSLDKVFLPETTSIFVEEMVGLWEGRRRFESEARVRKISGGAMDVILTMAFGGERCEQTLVSILDISQRKAAESALRSQTKRLEALNALAKTISSELNLDHIVQSATDTATDVIGAKFGAFFYNVTDEAGERYTLYALSGAPREAFERFGLPRKTAVFAPTFRGEAIIRSDDIRADPRYGKSAPHHGMPKGHLPVVSYLAAPVVSRSGEVHGGLFFGHDEPGMFTPDSEDIVAAIAAHTAIAIDNANLLKTVQRELEQRKHAEEQKNLLLREMDHRIKNLFSLSASIVTLSARTVKTKKELVGAVQQRLGALARAHSLTMKRLPVTEDGAAVTLHSLIRIVAAPYEDGEGSGRITVDGSDFTIGDTAVTHLALLFHELTTNAAKYGALSAPRGSVAISCRENGEEVVIDWIESGGPPLMESSDEGFGTLIGKVVAEGQLQGSITRDWNPEGLRIRVTLARDRLAEE